MHQASHVLRWSTFGESRERVMLTNMADNLHDLLRQNEPVALQQIERALAAQDHLSADQEAVLDALIWKRYTCGPAGLLGCILHQDCARLFPDLPNKLERIGATDAAVATRELRNAIPLDEEQIRGGLTDWVETQSEVVTIARELDENLIGLDEVDQTIWDFMKDTASDIPDLEIPTRTESIVSSIVGLFRSSNDQTA